MNKYMLGILLALGVSFAVTAKEAEKKEEPKGVLACAKNDDIVKIMEEKGYAILLNMTRKENNKEGIVESLWIGGESIAITATAPNSDSSCLLANMVNVTVNPNAIEAIWENYKKQNKQKDI